MAAQPLILAVDDEPGILRLLRLELAGQGFRVITASGGEEALRLVEDKRPDAILLDITMPGMSGLVVMGRIREYSAIPILLVSGKIESTMIEGLGLGADDYIVKPFNPEEVGARVRAVLRRVRTDGTRPVVRAGEVEVDLVAHLVRRAGERVVVTRTEWLILEHLAANAGKVVPSTELLSTVWGPEYRDDVQYLRVWITQLRAKLEMAPADPQIIKTASGVGYLFAETGT